MNTPFGRLQDVPDAISYVNSVTRYLSEDKQTLSDFSAEVSIWAEQGTSNAAPDACLARIATVLRYHPSLLQDFNALLGPGQTLECSTTLENEEVKFVVFIKDNSAQIIPTCDRPLPPPSGDLELRKIILSKDAWKEVLESSTDKDWLACISQVLQVILDDPSIDTKCYRRAHRCLRELADRSILPPSIFVDNPFRGDERPRLVQSGIFADIYTGSLRDMTICFRALRIFEEPGIDRELLYKDFCSEVLLWRQLNHVNILPFMGANLNSFPPKFCVMSPWMYRGDIMSFLKQHPTHNRLTSICEIVDGIEYLHNLDPPIAHNAIKGANVLVKDDLVCCLADFGLSSVVEPDSLGSKSSRWIGSIAWTAPEIMDPNRYTTYDARASDIYALACTIYEIYTGKPPFLDTHTVVLTIMLSVTKGERPPVPPPGEWTPEEKTIWWLVELCWQDNPVERPEIRLIKHSLRDIGLLPSLRSQPPILASSHPTNVPSTNDPGPALQVISKCLQWVLDVDGRHPQQVETIESKVTSFSDGYNDLSEHDGPVPQQQIMTTSKDTAMNPASNFIAREHEPILLQDPAMRRQSSTPSESLATTLSDDEERPTLSETSNPRLQQESVTLTSMHSFSADSLLDPTSHLDLRAIARLGDRSQDVEHGRLSYLIALQRKFMGGSTISGESPTPWRNENTISDDSETNSFFH